MICDPNDNNLNPPNLGPPPFIPGFGTPFVPFRIPVPDITIPEGIPEDIIELIESLLTAFPGAGNFIPNPGNFTKDIWDAIASLLNQIAPFLALYNFFFALLNMVLCIIDVLCALVNPFKVASAIRRLFKRCLPQFIALFPWLALLAMLLALLLLLLALIEYIINRILQYIRDIIENILLLAEAIQLDDSESILAVTLKIAYLLCLIEQIFAILIAFQTIFAIIQQLFSLAGRSVCASGSNRVGDDNDCCTPEVCPPFISEQPDGFEGSQGQLNYLRQRTDSLTGAIVRPESYQFFDANFTSTFEFIDIVTPILGFTFWPDGLVFSRDTNLNRVPYILDITVEVDPFQFGFAPAPGPLQTFAIKDIVVNVPPTTALKLFSDTVSIGGGVVGSGNIPTGVLNLEGGLVFSVAQDGYETPFEPNGTQLTLETFIQQPSAPDPIIADDTLVLNLITFNLRINHEALNSYGIITALCIPDLQNEANNFAARTPFDSVDQQIGALPDVGNAVTCLQTSINNLRQDVSVENAQLAQAELVQCLEDLRGETEASFLATISAGTSVFDIEVILDPTLQFVGLGISVSVRLFDSNQVLLSRSIPSNLASQVADLLSATVTLGDISDFTYDGYERFIANITSDDAGVGNATVFFNNSAVSDVLNLDDLDTPTEVRIRPLPYEFIGSPGVDDIRDRRDEVDIAVN